MLLFYFCINLVLALEYQLYSNPSGLTAFYKSSEKFSLANAYSSQYYMKVILGSDNREFILSLDTESTWMWLLSSNTQAYNSLQYDPQNQTCDFSQNISVKYSIGSISGPVCKDELTLKSYNIQVPFISAYSQHDLYWIITDGYLGLGLDKDMSNSVVQILHDEEKIRKKLFSIFLSKDEKDMKSVVYFGRHEAEDYSDSDAIVVNVTGSQWRSEIVFKSFGRFVNDSADVLFSPGFFGIFVPQNHWDLVLSEISARIECENFLVFLECNGDESSLPTFNFSYNHQNLTVFPQTYTYRSSDSLIVLIGSHNESHWVLGQPLFKEYYSVFDMQNEAISLYKVSKKQGISILIYFIVCVFLVVVIFVPLLVYWFVSKKKTDNDLSQTLIN